MILLMKLIRTKCQLNVQSLKQTKVLNDKFIHSTLHTYERKPCNVSIRLCDAKVGSFICYEYVKNISMIRFV